MDICMYFIITAYECKFKVLWIYFIFSLFFFSPDTASFIQKIEAMKIEKAEGKDNRSFFAKYVSVLFNSIVSFHTIAFS